MDHFSHNNGNNQMSELNSDTTSVVLRNETLESVTYGEPIDRHGVKMRKITKTTLVPRRTFIKGTLKGKYWGEHENNDASPKDVGQFYNITLYESEIFVDREVIRTERSTTFSDFLTEISRANSFTSYQHIDPSQLKNNFLVVHHEGSVNRYKIDLHEPRLYNPKIVHALHQSSDQEVFGSIESNICGYLLDKKEVIEETYEVVEEPNTPKYRKPIEKPEQKPEGGDKLEGIIGVDQPDQPPGGSDIKPPLDKWVLLPLLLILLLCLLALITLNNPSLWIIPIVALLFFAFQKPGFKFSGWIYAILFVLIGFALWNALQHNTPIKELVRGFSGRGSFDGSDSEKDNGNVVTGPTKGNIKGESVTRPSKDSTNVIVDASQKIIPPTASTVPSPEGTKIGPTEKIDKITPPSVNSKISSFNSLISKGLKAVEDEEYILANQNFRKASNLDPSNPRLQKLANRYIKLADEKCKDFRNANAKELMHIPNNYYQYAASLTQTAPLKCE
jgi:hypothetical protein